MRERSGFFYTFGAYLFWGAVFPVFFAALSSVNAFEIVPVRTFSSLVFAALIVLVSRSWPQVVSVFRSPQLLGALALAGGLLYVNWQTYVYATTHGHIIEASLGYFINPFVTILLGVFIRHERLTRLQWVSLGIASVAVIVLTINYGQLPWLALLLSLSFGFYGFVKKQRASSVDASVGMTVETIVMLPVAVIQLLVLMFTTGQLSAFSQGLDMNLLLLASGPVTIFPLILFAAGTKRLPLIYVGFIQFLTPILTFLYGYLFMHEAMPVARWVGFIIIWIALVVLAVDLVRRMRKKTQWVGEASAQVNRVR